MSVSSLPEWKQLLLERKRREEEERERKEKQEEQKFASMPAWKRGIIQRRKAKQDSLGDREKEKDVCLLHVDVRSPSDGLSDTDSSVTVNLGSEVSLSPDPGLWLDAEVKPASQVSLETIVPVHENPFIRTQSSWKKGRDSEVGNEPDVKEKEKDKLSPKSQDGESGRGRDIELKIERFRDLSEGQQKERSRDRSQGRERETSRGRWDKEKSQWKESVKDVVRERELLKVRKDEDEKETDPSSSPFPPNVSCLRTIRADNIIIIEQERKGSDERRARWRDAERERTEEDHQTKRGMKMDIREILAGGGSVTEIRASEVLIIKPSESPEERNMTGGGGKGLGWEEGEMKGSMDGRWESTSRELRTDISWLRDKEKERPWGQATVIKEDRKDSLDDNVFVDRGGRVSQLLSKFGEHPKPPSRSKSSDNFLRPGRRKYSGDEEDHQSEADGRNLLLKGIPKRSFSFSDRVICAKENGLDDDGLYGRKMRERIHSEKSVAQWVDIASLGKETTSKIKLGCARLLDKERFAKYREKLKNEDGKGGPTQKRNEAEASIQKSDVKRTEPVDTKAPEKSSNQGDDEGFTVVSVKNTEGISFARRVPIRHDGRSRAEREVKRLIGEKSSESGLGVEKDPEEEGQIKEQVYDKKLSNYWREEGTESTNLPQTYSVAVSADLVSPGHPTESQHRHESAFSECSSQVQDRSPDWSSTGPQQPYSVLSQHTEDLISKIEKMGEMTLHNSEVNKESKQEGHMYNETRSDSLGQDVALRSPKTSSMGIPPGPLEIQIPRTVFYVAEEVVEKKKSVGQSNEGPDWEEGKGVERRDSWRIGKPLSRIESLREKIRQRELERLKQKEAQDGGGSDAVALSVSQAAEDRQVEKGTEIEKEWEVALHMQNSLGEAESGEEDAAGQTSMTAFDVTQEAGTLKTCPQLPVSVPHSQADKGGEVTSGYAAAPSEVISDNFQILEDEDDPAQHVGEEQLRQHRAQRESTEEREEEQEQEEEKELLEEGEEEEEEYASQPHPNSLAAMSRIYNLEKVGSRSGLCVRERAVDIPSVHLVKVKPLISITQQADSEVLTGDDMYGVQTVQQQIEQFQLKEQEVLKPCTLPNAPLKDRETKEQQSHQGKTDGKAQEKDQETSSPKVAPECVQSPTSPLRTSKQTITISPTILRSHSPDNTLKPSDCTPTPASSPSSPSPAQSPSISPSPSPSPTLFSIRSASGGKVKRGATITVTPRKPTGAGGEVTKGSTVQSKSSPQQAQTSSTVAEPEKKKYPTVEEIEVIGGYQNLEKSCLVKNRLTPKRVSGNCFCLSYVQISICKIHSVVNY